MRIFAASKASLVVKIKINTEKSYSEFLCNSVRYIKWALFLHNIL